MNFKVFEGSLNHRNKLPSDVLRAYRTFKNQKSRCLNSKIRSFRDYGSKGIRVEYTVREFVGWYLQAIKKFKGKEPTVGRIDHSKNYRFDNIEIQEKSKNSSEAMDRTKNRFSYPVVAVERKSGKKIGVFNSMKQASIACGSSFSTVQRQCNNEYNGRRTNIIYSFHKGGKQ